MLQTRLCKLLGIDHPIIQAGMGPWGSDPELAAAVSNAGALGTLGASGKPLDELKRQLMMMRELTDRTFAVNLVLPMLTDDNFQTIIQAKPPAFSLALGDPGDFVKQVHDVGSIFIQQIHNVQQALLAAERGVDIIVAQGSEAGGEGGRVAALPLVPQVVDAVDPIPVVAAGGVGDGRGLAAVLTLGAQGAQLGTRFLASHEAAISEEWKRAIIEAGSEDAIKVEVWRAIFPIEVTGAFETVPRALRTPFIERWERQAEEARRERDRLREEVFAAIAQGRTHEYVPYTGQSSGLVRELLPAADIVRRLVREAEEALGQASTHLL